MSTDARAGWIAGVLLALVGLGTAALARPDAPVRLDAPTWEGRARMVGLQSTAASLLWARAVQTFGSAVLEPDAAKLESAAPRIGEDVSAATRLDPSFSDPWLGGLLMLRVAGAHEAADALTTRGRRVRADLPWHLLDVR